MVARAEITLLPYPIVVERGILSRLGEIVIERAPAHRYAIITDSNVGPIYGSGALSGFPRGARSIIQISAGEEHKNRDTWGYLTDQLLSVGAGRDTTIVALGGGVVGDLAGFVAATFMRGVSIIQVPTSLLAMIDASIGGKTGVDTPAGKNLVGAFHNPDEIVIDPEVLATLPLTSLRTGFAEAIKHGVIADSAYFEFVRGEVPSLLSPGGIGGDSVSRVIVRSIEIKAEVVSRDERESGLRKVLNFGHTIGHALEHLSGYALSHGEAVSIGMVLESTLAERAGIAEAGTSAAVRDALTVAGLPVDRPKAISGEKIMDTMRADKKARGGRIEYALPSRIGAMAGKETGWAVPVDEDIVLEVLT